MSALNIPILRWGQPYTSLETEDVVHFVTGETLAKVSQANPGLLGRDMRHASRARQVLTGIPVGELIGMMKTAAELYASATLPMGDGAQTPDDFARQQSASTGLPEHMCKANMSKNRFVLTNMDRILEALTRGPTWASSHAAMASSRGASWSVIRRNPRSWVWCCPRTLLASTPSGCR
jgi:hypothetical protein